MFYIQRRHIARAVHETFLPFKCPLCGFAGYAFVSAAAEGTAVSPYMLGSSTGDARAYESARRRARSAAERALLQRECPECGRAANKPLLFAVHEATVEHLVTPEQPAEEALDNAVYAAGLTLEQVGEADLAAYEVRRNGSIRLWRGDEEREFRDVNDAVEQIQRWQEEVGADGSSPASITLFCEILQRALEAATDDQYDRPLEYLMGVVNDEDLDERCGLVWREDGSSRRELGVVEDPNGTEWVVAVRNGRVRYKPAIET